jgi:hypothetical protein
MYKMALWQLATLTLVKWHISTLPGTTSDAVSKLQWSREHDCATFNLWAKDVERVQIHSRFCAPYQNNALPWRRVNEWIDRFKKGRRSVTDLECSGHPFTSNYDKSHDSQGQNNNKRHFIIRRLSFVLSVCVTSCIATLIFVCALICSTRCRDLTLSFFSEASHCKKLMHNVKYVIKIHDFDLFHFSIQRKTACKNSQCYMCSVIKLPVDVAMWKIHCRRTMCM